MLLLGEARTRQCVARGEEIAGRGEVEMRQEGMTGRAHSKAGGTWGGHPADPCSLMKIPSEMQISRSPAGP